MHANEDKISERVIACAFAVSNGLGAGFLEAVYPNALALELNSRKIVFESQKPINVSYRGCTVGHYGADFVVDRRNS